MKRWLQHIEALAVDIGPGGSTPPGGRGGTEYCEIVLRDLGLDARVETFLSAQAIFLPHLIAGGLMLGERCAPSAGGWGTVAAAVLSVSPSLLT